MPQRHTIIMSHGGDLSEAAQRYEIAVEDWLDLSTGINPLAYPLHTIHETAWSKLPQKDDYDRLIAAARRAYRIPPHLDIIAAPGTQAVLQWLPRLVEQDEPIAIPTRTYGEHETVWRGAGHAITSVNKAAEALVHPLAAIVNPNNPDGSLLPPRTVLDRRSHADARGLLIVDEAFADCDPAMSVLPLLTDEPVAVLRSFGKFFGLAGLRLGFLIGQPGLAGRLATALGPWAVSGPALALGARALGDADWVKATRAGLETDRRAFDTILAEAGLAPTGTVPLYRLVIHDAARHLHEHLARTGIWTRIFDHDARWIRLGVPRTDEARERVRAALRRL